MYYVNHIYILELWCMTYINMTWNILSFSFDGLMLVDEDDISILNLKRYM